MWFYSIRGTGNRSVRQSQAIYETELLATTAGTEYLKINKPSIQRADDVNELFTVTAGRTAKPMKRTFVATLMAGVVGTEHYGLEENDKVFIVDADGESHEVSEQLAAKVRAQIGRGKKPSG
jgi:hypothetical protein